MLIAVTGSSGLIGSALVPALRADGHDVLRIVRRTPQRPDEVGWQPSAGDIDANRLTGVAAVIHLAGAGVGERRWSARYRREICASRVDGTATISAALAQLDPRPRVLLSASAVGYYGATGARDVDESAPSGTGFLAEVVRQWEAATRPAEQAGVRVVHLRTAVVLAGRGGALGRVLPLFRLGLGGRLGSGRQWMSWISLPDEIAAIRFLLSTPHLHGPVNLSTPNPVTNAEYTAALGRAVSRPAALVVPACALRVALGGFADEGVLASQRVVPGALEQAGFRFAHPRIAPALAAVI